MLTRAQRLTTAQFARAFRDGRIVRHPLLQARVWPRADKSEAVRAAFVAPKKVGKAAARNRLRRRARERFRLLKAAHDPKLRGCDLIFVLAASAQTAAVAALDAALEEVLRRAQRIAAQGRSAAQNPDGARGPEAAS